MAKTAARMYTCKTCGLVTTSKGHLCSPTPVTSLKVARCGYCGEVSSDPRHVCQPKLVALKFFCENCGRLSNSRSMLCRPKSVPKGSSGSKSKKTSKKKTVKAKM